jgi:hypothetical protein
MTQLSRLQENWKRTVDQSAESARQQFITPGYGQALVYETKRREAALVTLLLGVPTEPTQADCPHLWAEAAGLGLPLADLAAEVTAQAAAWVAASAAIEVLRLGAKAAIDAAETEAAIVAAAQNAMTAWPKPQE